MFKVLGAALAALVLSWAAPASAAVVFTWSGPTADWGDEALLWETDLGFFASGRYNFHISGPAKATSASVTIRQFFHWHEYDANGVELWGNNGDYDDYKYPGAGLTGAADGYRGTFVVPQNFISPTSQGGWWDQGHWATISIDLWLPLEAVGETFTLTVSSVPEPQTWLIMIVGFGLAGAALRHRQITAQAS